MSYYNNLKDAVRSTFCSDFCCVDMIPPLQAHKRFTAQALRGMTAVMAILILSVGGLVDVCKLSINY